MDRPVIGDGAVLIEGERIVEVGEAAAVSRAHRDAEHVDLGETVVLPGLINAHVHLELSDLARIGDRWTAPLADWLIEIIKTAPADGDAARVTRGVEMGVAQCLRFGVTTVG